jgi:hypothetical protein
LKGAACKTEIGTVQLFAMPVQPGYVEYVIPSLCRIYTVYLVIGVLPNPFAAHVITTSVPEIVAIRAAGALGVLKTAPLPSVE